MKLLFFFLSLCCLFSGGVHQGSAAEVSSYALSKYLGITSWRSTITYDKNFWIQIYQISNGKVGERLFQFPVRVDGKKTDLQILVGPSGNKLKLCVVLDNNTAPMAILDKVIFRKEASFPDLPESLSSGDYILGGEQMSDASPPGVAAYKEGLLLRIAPDEEKDPTKTP